MASNVSVTQSGFKKPITLDLNPDSAPQELVKLVELCLGDYLTGAGECNNLMHMILLVLGMSEELPNCVVVVSSCLCHLIAICLALVGLLPSVLRSFFFFLSFF